MVKTKKQLGQILLDAGRITKKQLQEALLGQTLLEADRITKEQLQEALAKTQNGKSLVRSLSDLGYITEVEISTLLAKNMGLSFIDLSSYQINPSAAKIITEDIARRYFALPINFENEKLVLAMADPSNVFAVDDLRIITGYDIKPVVVTESERLAAINQFCQMDTTVQEAAETAAESAASAEKTSAIDAVEAHEIAEEAPIVKLVNLIISQAVRDRASDIHIEPQEKELRIRYRIDGVLHEVMTSPKQIQAGVISRLKIMADMNIAERRVPQDGRFGIIVGGSVIDLRVASLPTVYGEKIVLRILEKSSVMLSLDQLGFRTNVLDKFKSSFTKPYGAILVTGPTGSGKSTTLYATLNVLNSSEKNIITVEDPVEYRLAGINQIQTNPVAGLTFASGLRSILRCDPDIVMIGEIRDRETALIAIESALTGHLVLSTLHTNDASGALTRLIEMGIEPFLIASSVDCILAQRLARVLCPKCKEAYKPSAEALKKIGFPIEPGEELTLYKPKGCNKCNKTGYKGRIGIYEVLLVSETIERMTVEGKSAAEIKKQAISEGMKTLRDDGFEKVKEGKTSVEDVMRVIV
jgi:type IV pilus assembly protein PilB